jgi:hypothetical protein
MSSLLALLGVGYFALWSPRMVAQELSAESLLRAVHSESKLLSVTDRMMVLYDLAIAATAEDPATSAAWALEATGQTLGMHGVARHRDREYQGHGGSHVGIS